MPGKLIGFIGAIGSGKSTVAKSCITPWGSRRVAFATPMRAVMEAMGVTVNYHTHNKDEPIPHLPGNTTARKLLQTLGTDWGRNMIHPDLWMRIVMNDVCALMERDIDVYIDDCRFPNEAKAIREAGGVIVRINPGPKANVSDMHESEEHWQSMEYDYLLKNTGTAQDLIKEYKELGI